MGIILGIILTFLLRNRLQTDIYLLNEEWIVQVQSSQLNSKSLFVYILVKRLKDIGILLLLSTTVVGCFCLYGYSVLLGVGTGLFVAIACLRYGIRGLMMFLWASFPQCLLYIPAFICIFHFCYSLCIKLHYPHKDVWRSTNSTKIFLLKNIMYLFIIVIVVIIAVLLESYVNPKIFFSFIKKF